MTEIEKTCKTCAHVGRLPNKDVCLDCVAETGEYSDPSEWSPKPVSYRIVGPAREEPRDVPTITRTLRDEFAMAALAGMLANPVKRDRYEVYAIDAYRSADAMLKAREA